MDDSPRAKGIVVLRDWAKQHPGSVAKVSGLAWREEHSQHEEMRLPQLVEKATQSSDAPNALAARTATLSEEEGTV